MNIKDDIWFQVLQPINKPTKRLFCIPYAGGSASAFAGWQDSLPAGIEVCAIQLPGHFGRMHEACYTDLQTIIDALVSAIKPYLNDCDFYFYGHSMGARLAFELANALSKQGLNLPKELFVSGAKAPHLPRNKKPIHALSHDDFFEEIDRINGTPRAVLENKELAELILPILRADFQVCETWSFDVEDVLNIPLRVFGGLSDPGVSMEDIDAWELRSSSDFKRHMFPGDHFFINPHKDKLLRLIAKYILL